MYTARQEAPLWFMNRRSRKMLWLVVVLLLNSMLEAATCPVWPITSCCHPAQAMVVR
jgi:hypothetical protein